MIRKADEKDFLSIFNIFWENYEELTELNKKVLMEASRQIWGDDYYFLSIDNLRKSDYEIYVYEINGEVIGFISFKDERDYIYLDEIHIKRDFRGKGIGSKLLELLKSFRKPIIAEAHEKSVDFFLKHGFKVVFGFRGYGDLIWYRIFWEPDL